MDKIFTVTFLSDTNIFRQVSGLKLEEEETLESFIKDRAIPRLRRDPASNEEAMGAYHVCVASEISVEEAVKEIKEKKKTKETKETITETNTLNDPQSLIKYLKVKYCKTAEEKRVLTRILKRIKS